MKHEGQWKKGTSGNSKGRPRGAKNKNKLPRPDRILLGAEDGAIQMLVAMAKNDFKKLERSESIPANVQFQAIKEVLERLKEAKARLAALDGEDEDDDEDNKVTPLFSTTAK